MYTGELTGLGEGLEKPFHKFFFLNIFHYRSDYWLLLASLLLWMFLELYRCCLGVVVVFVVVLVGLFFSWDERGEVISRVHSSVCLLSLEVVGVRGGGA